LKYRQEINNLRKQELVRQIFGSFLLRHGMSIIGEISIISIELDSTNLITIRLSATDHLFREINANKKSFRHFLAERLNSRFAPKIFFINLKNTETNLVS